jgi:hypothetical protein
VRFIAIAALLALLIPCAGCVGARLEDGNLVATVSPPASVARVQEGEKIAKEYADALGDAIKDIAEQVGNAEAAATVDAAAAERGVKQMVLDAIDKYSAEWLNILLAGLGIGGVAGGGVYVARRKIKAAREELPEGYEEVADEQVA